MRKAVVHRGKELLEQGQGFALAKVLETSGSTPRKSGAWLLVEENGSSIGTIGGGTLEAEVIKIAFDTLAYRENRVHEFSLTPGDHGGIDMRCGGNVKVAVSYVDPDHREELDEGLGQQPKVYVFGAGHVAKALVPILHSVEFDTVVIDDRAEFANSIRFPESELIVSHEYTKLIPSLAMDVESCIVIVTRGHSYDLEVLREAIKKPAAYIGMIGSRKKIAHTFAQLEGEGVSRDTLTKVHTPIGIEIGAETPEEIAISIAAELISIRSSRREGKRV